MASRLRKGRRRRADETTEMSVGIDKQSHQLPAVTGKLRGFAVTGDYVTRQGRIINRAFLDVTELWLGHVFVARFYF